MKGAGLRDVGGNAPFRFERAGEVFVREGSAIDGLSAGSVAFREVL